MNWQKCQNFESSCYPMMDVEREHGEGYVDRHLEYLQFPPHFEGFEGEIDQKMEHFFQSFVTINRVAR